jgi:hypothetical protein
MTHHNGYRSHHNGNGVLLLLALIVGGFLVFIAYHALKSIGRELIATWQEMKALKRPPPQ